MHRVLKIMISGMVGLLCAFSAIAAESEADKTMRENMKNADAVKKRQDAEATKEKMRDKTHDGYNRYKTGPDSSVGVNPTEKKDGAIIDYTIKGK